MTLLQNRAMDSNEALQLGLAQRLIDVADWQTATDEIIPSLSVLARGARADILHLTSPDTRHEDMAALVQTASRPGLKERIGHYRNSLWNERGKLAYS